MHPAIRTCFSAVIVIGLYAVARPAAPSSMTIQGRLTDPGGAPHSPGVVQFVFAIFDHQTAGNRIWPSAPGEETQSITVGEDGLWEARVGAHIPLTESVFADSARWLQITVVDGANPPATLPRIKLATSPFAFRAAVSDVAGDAEHLSGVTLVDVRAEIDADVAAHAASGDHDSRYFTESESDNRFVNTSGDVLTGTLTAPQINAGSLVQNGQLNVYRAGSMNPVVKSLVGANGGGLQIQDETANVAALIEADVSGEGGSLSVMRSATNPGFVVDGNKAGSQEPWVQIMGSTRSVSFDLSQTGNASVSLPTDAVAANEILNEPGIASNRNSAVIALTQGSATHLDLVTVTINTPTDGYIRVEGRTTFEARGTTGANRVCAQIDSTAGGGDLTTHYVKAGLPAYVSTALADFPVYVDRVFSRPAGTYTFRLEARAFSDNGAAAASEFENSFITATFFPTSYGAVNTTASAQEAAELRRDLTKPER